MKRVFALLLCCCSLLCGEDVPHVAPGYHVACQLPAPHKPGTIASKPGPWRLVYVDEDQTVTAFDTDPKTLAEVSKRHPTTEWWGFVQPREARGVNRDITEWHVVPPQLDGMYEARVDARAADPEAPPRQYYWMVLWQGGKVYRAGSAEPLEPVRVTLWGSKVPLDKYNARVRVGGELPYGDPRLRTLPDDSEP